MNDSGKPSEPIQVRTRVRAGGLTVNHSEALTVRTRADGVKRQLSQAVVRIG